MPLHVQGTIGCSRGASPLSNCPSERWRVRVGMLESRVRGSMAECLVPAGSPNSVLHPLSLALSHSKDAMPASPERAIDPHPHMYSLGSALIHSSFLHALIKQHTCIPFMLLLFAVSLSKRLPLDVPEQERVSTEKSQCFRRPQSECDWSIKATHRRLIRMRRFADGRETHARDGIIAGALSAPRFVLGGAKTDGTRQKCEVTRARSYPLTLFGCGLRQTPSREEAKYIGDRYIPDFCEYIDFWRWNFFLLATNLSWQNTRQLLLSLNETRLSRLFRGQQKKIISSGARQK
jgi:hypothetical protein